MGDPTDPAWVALPGATLGQKDLFVEIDYLSNLDTSVGPYKHSHLPKQAALDMVGNAFKSSHVDCDAAGKNCKGVQVHFDLGPGIYQSDNYVVKYPAPLPTGTTMGGNAIFEKDVMCDVATTMCQFPGQPAVGWKGGLLFVRDTAPNPNSIPPVPLLGNFQPGRGLSYHYVLFGHSLGDEESYWSTLGTALLDPALPQLVSIVNTGNSATVTIQSPAGVTKPGDCPNAGLPECSDANVNLVTIGGALAKSSLNGTYTFGALNPSTSNDVTTTTFTITTSNVPDGTYKFACGPGDVSDVPPCVGEPQLSVSYLGPTSSSGHSDFRGGGDSMVTFGLWGADENPSACQADPSQSLTVQKPAYCDNQLGSALKQAGTLMHELGHSLTLTHGGTYYEDPNNPSVPTYELNCKANFLSAMNYQFQVHGFPDNGAIVDFSGQTLAPQDETKLNETNGLNAPGFPIAAHYTRWYAPPNALDNLVGRLAVSHCDGSPLGPNESPAVHVDGNTFSAPIDWNNDMVIAGNVGTQDVNFNGISGDVPIFQGFPVFQGFNDWQAVDLLQIGARASAAGFSGTGGIKSTTSGGGIKSTTSGGGIKSPSGGGGIKSTTSGGGIKSTTSGGGIDVDEDAAHSSADAPTGLTCTVAQNITPACVSSSGSFTEKAKAVPLTWNAPGFGQTREYDVWRAVGNFPTVASVVAAVKANPTLFTNISGPLVGNPPSPTTFTDLNVRSNTTYTYFVTDKNKQGAKSGASAPIVVLVKF